VVPAFSPAGKITLPVVRLHLDIAYPHGRKERGDMTVVFDPQNHHYFWRYTPLNWPGDSNSFLDDLKSGREAAFSEEASLVDFVFSNDFFVKVYTQQADSLDAAERASIEEIQKNLAVFDAGYHTDYTPVDLRKAISAEFRCAPLHANCQDDLNAIASVSKQGSKWRLILHNRWDQEVILDADFNLVSTKQVTPPSKH